jgi:5-methylcytosine-specific restriction protein A
MTKHARICPCGYRVAGGTLCACQQRRQAARPSANARGYGTDWRELRATIPPTPCTACARPYKPGFHLDHRVARNAGGSDDASNLHWLCHSCHSRKTVKHDHGFGRGKYHGDKPAKLLLHDLRRATAPGWSPNFC